MVIRCDLGMCIIFSTGVRIKHKFRITKVFFKYRKVLAIMGKREQTIQNTVAIKNNLRLKVVCASRTRDDRHAKQESYL